MKVMVYPTSKNAMNIRHPDGNLPLRESGGEWPNDGFTARMLTDRAVTLDKSEGYVTPPPAAPAPVSPLPPAEPEVEHVYSFDDEPEHT